MLNVGSFPNSLLCSSKRYGPSTDSTFLRQIPIDLNRSFIWEIIAGYILLLTEKVSVPMEVDEAVFFIAVKQFGLMWSWNLTMILESWRACCGTPHWANREPSFLLQLEENVFLPHQHILTITFYINSLLSSYPWISCSIHEKGNPEQIFDSQIIVV